MMTFFLQFSGDSQTSAKESQVINVDKDDADASVKAEQLKWHYYLNICSSYEPLQVMLLKYETYFVFWQTWF